MVNDDIVYIQLSFRKLDVKLLTDFTLDKNSIVNDNMTSKEVYSITSTTNLPVSTNESYLGTPLFLEKKSKVDFLDNLITFIYVTINNETFNFLDNIKSQAKFLPSNHKDNISSFDSSFKFYLLYINTKYYILAVKFIIINHIQNMIRNVVNRCSKLDLVVLLVLIHQYLRVITIQVTLFQIVKLM